MATAYSYARFSSEKQKHGASLQRQLEAATKYAHNHSLVLDPSTYRDLGVSAFRSKNAEGALGAFIEAVESGRIAKGSYLLVESLDRLSRDKVPTALRLLLSLTEKGVVIVTLMDEQVYSEANITENWTKLVVACAIMARANEESATKAARAHDAIKRRADKGQIPTTRLPTWMKFSADRKSAVLIPARAKIVKRVFDDVIAGKGARQIARELNAEKAPVLFYATEWRQATISQLLKNPAAYGEFKGEIRLPAVVTKARFMKAQQIVRDRTLYKGGFSRSNPNNTFVGLGRCGHCGRTMRFLPRTDGTMYLKCVGSADNGVCNARFFPFLACETALVVHFTVDERHQEFLRNMFAEKHEQAQALEAEIAVIKGKQDTLLKIAEDSGAYEGVGIRIKKLQEDIDRLQSELKVIGTTASDDVPDIANLVGDYAFLANEVDGYKPRSDVKNITELRTKLKMTLFRVLKRIEFFDANPKRWKPTLRLTYVNDKTAEVDVTEWLPQRTQLRISHGYYRHTGGGRMPKRKKPSTKAG